MIKGLKFLLLIFVYSIVFNGISFGQLENLQVFTVGNTGLISGDVNDIVFDKNADKIWFGSNLGLNLVQGDQWDYFNADNSLLPSNNVKALLLDTEGKLWIGTDNGLVIIRDGNWEIINTDNSSILSNNITKIKQNKNGDIWLVCPLEGVGRFDGEDWKWYTEVIDGINWITDIAFDENMKVWASLNVGIANLEGSTWQVSHIDSLWSTCIAIDSVGNKWIGTEFRGLYKINETDTVRYTFENSDLPYDYITGMCIDPSNRLLIGSKSFQGLFQLDEDKWNEVDSNINYVSLIKFDHEDNLWISDFNNLMGRQISVKMHGTWKSYNTLNTGLIGNIIYDLAIDDNNVKWLCTNGGLCAFDGQIWKNFKNSNLDKYPTSPYKIHIDEHDTKWITYGTSANDTLGLLKFDNVSVTNINSSNSGLPYDYIYKLDVDTSGALWLLCEKEDTIKAVKYHDGNWEIVDVRPGIRDVNTFKVVDEKNIWLGTHRGLWFYDDLGWRNISENTNKNIWGITFDSNGNVWVGENGDGLAVYNGVSWQYFNESNSNVPDDGIISLYADENDNIWALTINGFFIFDGSKFENYEIEYGKGPKSKFIFDKNNNLWIASNSGLVTCKVEIPTKMNDSHLQISNYKLFQNYPNPFNPITQIKYSLPKQTNISIKIYDILGKEIQTLINKNQPRGMYKIDFDGSNLTSGIYFYRLKSDSFIETKKMALIK